MPFLSKGGIWAISFYALGLFSFGGIKILVSAFYALQDTRTPVKVAAGCLVINALLNVLLMYPLKIGGIALASAIAGTIDFLILFYVMHRRLNGFNFDLLAYFGKVAMASVMTGVFAYWCWGNLPIFSEVVRLLVVGFSGLIIYEFICLGFKIKQAQNIMQWIMTLNKKLNPCP